MRYNLWTEQQNSEHLPLEQIEAKCLHERPIVELWMAAQQAATNIGNDRSSLAIKVIKAPHAASSEQICPSPSWVLIGCDNSENIQSEKPLGFTLIINGKSL